MMMHPAPGFDDFLPHDLLHFVAEAEWRLDGAVFGQLAAGGDAGTFWAVEKVANKWKHRGEQLRKRRGGRAKGGGRSEVLAGVLEAAWNARHARRKLPHDWEERLELARVNPRHLERVVRSLDELAEQWHALHVGEALSLEWPRPERREYRRWVRRAGAVGVDSTRKTDLARS